MNDYRYTFEPYKGPASKHTCPACGHKQTFTRYIDRETGSRIHSSVGRCDRADKCGYHYKPADYFRDYPESRPEREEYFNTTRKRANSTTKIFPRSPTRTQKPGHIPKEYLINSTGFNSQFVAFLCTIFDRSTLESPSIWQIMKDYYLGQTKDGRVIYWQVDANRRIRTGKIMRYDPVTGKRVKEGKGSFDWVHSILIRDKKLPESFHMEQCLFGEHLLRRSPDKTVCVIESEKSAIIASAVMPEYLWLSTGGKSNYKADKCRALAGRNVLVFPDLGAFDDWAAKTPEIERQAGCQVEVVDLLERIATPEDRENGLDIADYLIGQLQESIEDHWQDPTEGIWEYPIEDLPSFDFDDLLFQSMIEQNAHLESFVSMLDLVNTSTGHPFRLNH